MYIYQDIHTIPQKIPPGELSGKASSFVYQLKDCVVDPKDETRRRDPESLNPMAHDFTTLKSQGLHLGKLRFLSAEKFGSWKMKFSVYIKWCRKKNRCHVSYPKKKEEPLGWLRLGS